jgi:hypothetical protein
METVVVHDVPSVEEQLAAIIGTNVKAVTPCPSDHQDAIPTHGKMV